MSYKIAFASSDGKQVNQSFGAASQFVIAEVTGQTWSVIEIRNAEDTQSNKVSLFKKLPVSDNAEPGSENAVDGNFTGTCESGADCGSAGGCGAGGGCGGKVVISQKVDLISDCRCVVCKKIGMSVQKQLNRLAIASFDIECEIEDALSKISKYFERIDQHQSLRGIAHPDVE